MAESDNARSGWTMSINGTADEPNYDQIVLARHGRPHIRLDISAPGIRSAGEDRLQQGRQAIQAALTAIQEALDSPSALPGFHP